MAKNRVSMKEKLNEENKAKESFFKNTEVEAKEDSREEIALMSVFDEKDKSTIVREALESYIPKEYLEKAKASLNK